MPDPVKGQVALGMVAMKNRYDPDNLFRLNQNIKPTRGAGEAALA